METSTWRKASHSGDQGQCVEVFGDLTLVRDSKNADGPLLTANVTTLVAYLKRQAD